MERFLYDSENGQCAWKKAKNSNSRILLNSSIQPAVEKVVLTSPSVKAMHSDQQKEENSSTNHNLNMKTSELKIGDALILNTNKQASVLKVNSNSFILDPKLQTSELKVDSNTLNSDPNIQPSELKDDNNSPTLKTSKLRPDNSLILAPSVRASEQNVGNGLIADSSMRITEQKVKNENLLIIEQIEVSSQIAENINSLQEPFVNQTVENNFVVETSEQSSMQNNSLILQKPFVKQKDENDFVAESSEQSSMQNNSLIFQKPFVSQNDFVVESSEQSPMQNNSLILQEPLVNQKDENDLIVESSEQSPIQNNSLILQEPFVNQNDENDFVLKTSEQSSMQNNSLILQEPFVNQKYENDFVEESSEQSPMKNHSHILHEPFVNQKDEKDFVVEPSEQSPMQHPGNMYSSPIPGSSVYSTLPESKTKNSSLLLESNAEKVHIPSHHISTDKTVNALMLTYILVQKTGMESEIVVINNCMELIMKWLDKLEELNHYYTKRFQALIKKMKYFKRKQSLVQEKLVMLTIGKNVSYFEKQSQEEADFEVSVYNLLHTRCEQILRLLQFCGRSLNSAHKKHKRLRIKYLNCSIQMTSYPIEEKLLENGTFMVNVINETTTLMNKTSVKLEEIDNFTDTLLFECLSKVENFLQDCEVAFVL